MTYCPDPRPLSPPEDLPATEPHPVWHFLSDDHEHEHWLEDPTDVDMLLSEYAKRGEPFTFSHLIVTD